ncbi:hypothetical protein BKA65DRAFT_274347 [Rhexocercosporidium sp. MPI-PUGE-AT-0058]|nr:hypothetical protein BKA65DRAFT_274347 [Rhexocercosporidium sp. MPI-PUGE-AT-0058]
MNARHAHRCIYSIAFGVLGDLGFYLGYIYPQPWIFGLDMKILHIHNSLDWSVFVRSVAFFSLSVSTLKAAMTKRKTHPSIHPLSLSLYSTRKIDREKRSSINQATHRIARENMKIDRSIESFRRKVCKASNDKQDRQASPD